MRAAVLTTSPVTMPSPSSGRAPNATTAGPGVDADPHVKLELRLPFVQLGDRLDDTQAGADRPLGIVLVRDRRAEDRHHRVADELLDGSTVSLELVPQSRVVRTDPGAYVFRVGPVGGGREADEIAEERRDDLRSSLGAAAATSDVPQPLQNLAPSGFPAPQLGQITGRS